MLILSLVCLMIGPVIHRAARGSTFTMAALDGFTLVAISGLVLLHIMPEGIQQAGWIAFAAAAVGFFLPTLLERWLKHAAQTTHRAALVLAMSGLALHATLDGAALAQPGQHLALAVVLHRLPVGLAIWQLLGGSRGHRTAVLTLGSVMVATLAGYLLGGDLPRGVALAGFESLVGGSLMHVVLHGSPVTGGDGRWRIGAGLGAAIGIALMIWIGHDHSHGEHMHNGAEVFLHLAKESAGPLLIAYLGASLLHAFLPHSTIGWLGRGSRLSQASRGMAFGLPLPICSCGVVPLYRGLIEKGASTAAAMAFLVATPEIGIDAILLSLPFLGPHLTVARIVAAAFVALCAGWIIGGMSTNSTPTVYPAENSSHPLARRLRDGFGAGFGGLVDNTAAWILLGLAIAAIGSGLLDARWLGSLPAGLDVLMMALLGIPTYVCASGATPLVGMLVAKGISPGAGLAFLLTGPGTNATTFGVLSRLHGPRVATAFGLLVGGLAVAIGLAVNPLLSGTAPHTVLSHIHHEHGSWWSNATLLAMTALYGASLIRQGPRHFVGHVFPMATHEHHEHDSDPQGHGGHDHSGHDHGDSKGCCGGDSDR